MAGGMSLFLICGEICLIEIMTIEKCRHSSSHLHSVIYFILLSRWIVNCRVYMSILLFALNCICWFSSTAQCQQRTLSCVCNRNQVHFPRRILQPSCVAFINTVDIVELAVCTAWERKPKFLSACRCNLCKVCTVRTCMGGPFFLSIFIVNSRSSSLSTLFWLCLFLSGHSN